MKVEQIAESKLEREEEELTGLINLEAFGVKLKGLREAKGVKRRELSERLQVPYNTLSNWELGISKPVATELMKISESLDVSVCELLNIAPSTVEFRVQEAGKVIDTFSSRMQVARLQKGMNKNQLANLLTVAPHSITSWEEGRTAPNLEKLMKISKVLDAPLEFLLEGKATRSKMKKEAVNNTSFPKRKDLILIKSTFSKRLKEKRLERSLTQNQLAKSIEISPIVIYKWETGRAIPSSDSLQKILNFFELSLDDFLKTPVKQGVEKVETIKALEMEKFNQEEFVQSETPLETVERVDAVVEEPIVEEKTVKTQEVQEELSQIIQGATDHLQVKVAEAIEKLNERILSEVMHLSQSDSLDEIELAFIEKVRQLNETEIGMLQSYLDYLISKK